VAFLVLLPYALILSEFTPIISATQARILPDFEAGGGASFVTTTILGDFGLTPVVL
jgi:hypothetical protein